MAKIPQYFAPKERILPSNAGYNAFETAGRRIGGMYAEAARQEIEASKLAGQVQYAGIEWPYVLSSLAPAETSTPGTASVKSIDGGSSSGSGFGEEVFPNLATENSAASATLNETPATSTTKRGNALQNYTSAMNNLYGSYGLSTAPKIGQAGYDGPNALAEKGAKYWAKSLPSSVPTGGDTATNTVGGQVVGGGSTSTDSSAPASTTDLNNAADAAANVGF